MTLNKSSLPNRYLYNSVHAKVYFKRIFNSADTSSVVMLLLLSFKRGSARKPSKKKALGRGKIFDF